MITWGVNINRQGSHRLTPLVSAAQSNQLKIAELLLQNGAYLHYVTPQGYTPIKASLFHSEECMIMFFIWGVDVNTLHHGHTLSIDAAFLGFDATVSYFFEKKRYKNEFRS